ncbi:hydroxyisourate hydrolase [Pedobacter flavus]|uniref:5-hydroxyisourate hydrolase n=1 Tax=Pedobacter flavus TaxID=3113906 RepID=A0ABU7H2A4_9SPHI|nr:hydroxyisourate hydrolase [Pedobacter sp. VNH31]MEE1885448.1 hydroxyisourate hydrolase [Pedobacter sp. VNH31]
MKKIILCLLLSFSVSLVFAQTKVYQLSSHILDVSTGLPVPNVTVKLLKLNETDNKWTSIDQKITDKNGRIMDFLDKASAKKGIYKLTFLIEDYYKVNKIETFYPFIEVVFQIKDDNHYHVPITLSPFGYSTYRGN